MCDVSMLSLLTLKNCNPALSWLFLSDEYGALLLSSTGAVHLIIQHTFLAPLTGIGVWGIIQAMYRTDSLCVLTDESVLLWILIWQRGVLTDMGKVVFALSHDTLPGWCTFFGIYSKTVIWIMWPLRSTNCILEKGSQWSITGWTFKSLSGLMAFLRIRLEILGIKQNLRMTT